MSQPLAKTPPAYNSSVLCPCHPIPLLVVLFSIAGTGQVSSWAMPRTTNNEAEYQALLQAVEWLLERKELLADDIQICFRLNSNLVVSQLRGLWEIKEPRLQQLAGKVRSCLLQLPGTYTFEHIPREENAYADRLANNTLDKRA